MKKDLGLLAISLMLSERLDKLLLIVLFLLRRALMFQSKDLKCLAERPSLAKSGGLVDMCEGGKKKSQRPTVQ